MIRRINLVGGASSGKSTLAPKIYSALKVKGIDIELCREGEIKHKAYSGQKPEGWDQLAIFSEHLYEEYRLLKYCNFIVTDAPVMLGAAYANIFKAPYAQELLNMAMRFDLEYPPLNIWVQRDHPYQTQGRFEEEAVAEARTGLIWEFYKGSTVQEAVKSTIDLDFLVNSYVMPHLK